jgi:hypothetical protein
VSLRVFSWQPLLLLFLYSIRKIILPLIPSNLANIGGFDITKDLLIMVVFAFLMIATSFSMIKNQK